MPSGPAPTLLRGLATGRILLPCRELATMETVSQRGVKTVALIAFLALVGLTLWATGHLVIR